MMATEIPLTTPLSGPGRSLIAISSIAIRERRMYSIADLARNGPNVATVLPEVLSKH